MTGGGSGELAVGQVTVGGTGDWWRFMLACQVTGGG